MTIDQRYRKLLEARVWQTVRDVARDLTDLVMTDCLTDEEKQTIRQTLAVLAKKDEELLTGLTKWCREGEE